MVSMEELTLPAYTTFYRALYLFYYILLTWPLPTTYHTYHTFLLLLVLCRLTHIPAMHTAYTAYAAWHTYTLRTLLLHTYIPAFFAWQPLYINMRALM